VSLDLKIALQAFFDTIRAWCPFILSCKKTIRP